MGTRKSHRGSEEASVTSYKMPWPVVFPAVPWLLDGNRFEPLLESSLAHIKAQECPDVEVFSPFLSKPYPPSTNFKKTEEMVYLNPKLNEIIEEFLLSDATHLWFVDADNEVPPDALCKLLDLDVDIASGVSPPHFSKRKSTALKWMAPPSPEYAWSRPWYRSYKMRDVLGKILGEDRFIATGHFCMVCKRRVFEPTSPLHEPLRFIYEPPQRFHNEVLFWHTAQELGFTCRIHGGCLCGHLPEFPLEMIKEEYGL